MRILRLFRIYNESPLKVLYWFNHFLLYNGWSLFCAWSFASKQKKPWKDEPKWHLLHKMTRWLSVHFIFPLFQRGFQGSIHRFLKDQEASWWIDISAILDGNRKLDKRMMSRLCDYDAFEQFVLPNVTNPAAVSDRDVYSTKKRNGTQLYKGWRVFKNLLGLPCIVNFFVSNQRHSQLWTKKQQTNKNASLYEFVC